MSAASLRTFFATMLIMATPTAHAADNNFFTSSAKPQSVAPAKAPTVADYETAEDALADLWSRLPYTTRHAMFVTRKAASYGDYDKRASNVFAPGEKLLSYIEPIGFGWKPSEAGDYAFGVTTDFQIVDRNGKILGGQEGFQKAVLTSHYKNREFFLNLSLSLDGVEAGDFVLVYTLHDEASGKTTRVEQPFTVKAAG